MGRRGSCPPGILRVCSGIQKTAAAPCHQHWRYCSGRLWQDSVGRLAGWPLTATRTAYGFSHPRLSSTRGKEVEIVAAGANIASDKTGDEAQILIRSGYGPVGIGASRAAVGNELVASGIAVDLFLLDDGFQHHVLVRDFDLVVIDALDPFAGGRLLPAGRLRELPSALARASAIVLTRTVEGQNYLRVSGTIRRWNATAPIFRASSKADGWFDLQGRRAELQGEAMAFCGLGNPASFWKQLEQDQQRVSRKWEYRDHHRYTDAEVLNMALAAREAGVRYLLTTEKDTMNLSVRAAAQSQRLGVEILWLKIAVEVERGEELVDLIAAALGASTNTRLRPLES